MKLDWLSLTVPRLRRPGASAPRPLHALMAWKRTSPFLRISNGLRVTNSLLCLHGPPLHTTLSQL
jgi:hypothetical protein